MGAPLEVLMGIATDPTLVGSGTVGGLDWKKALRVRSGAEFVLMPMSVNALLVGAGFWNL